MLLNLLEESWVVGCNLKKREWSLENVSWQRTWHIVQIRNCSLFSVLTASFFFCTKAVDCFNCCNSEKRFSFKEKSGSGKHLMTTETQYFSYLFLYHTALLSFLLLTDDSGTTPDLRTSYVQQMLIHFGAASTLS